MNNTLEHTDFNVGKIRADFPILQREINGKPLIYLDNAATSQTPKQVIQVIVDYYTNYNANIHRGVHTLSQEATDLYEQARIKIQKHFNIKHSHEVILSSGTTHGINLVATGFSTILKKGDEGVGFGIGAPQQYCAVANVMRTYGCKIESHPDGR